jgi:hypothetical protein
MDRDGDAEERNGDQHPAQGVEVGHQRLDGSLRLSQYVLQHFNPGRSDRGCPRSAATFQGTTVGQDLARRSGANGTGRTGNGSPQDRAGPRSMCMKPERG